MRSRSSILFGICVMSAALALGCGSDDTTFIPGGGSGDGSGGSGDGSGDAAAQSIAEIASGDENFSTLVTALDAAGLVDTFASPGDFTVFAPTNDAFAGLPDGLLDAALADIELLTDVLELHVIDGTVMAADIAAGESFVTTLGGTKVLVVNDDNGVSVGGAAVSATDIAASNGVIHVLDNVILPSTSIIDLAANYEGGAFDTLVTAVTAASLASTLAGEGTFTVFAPSNDAFAALPEGTVEGLLADVDALTNVLLYHVLDSTVLSTDLADGDTTVTTLSGADITVTKADGAVTIGDATVFAADVEASNGVIHAIDGVLLPPS